MATASNIQLPSTFNKYTSAQRSLLQTQIFNQLRAAGYENQTHPNATVTTKVTLSHASLLSPFTVQYGSINNSNSDIPPYYHDSNKQTHIYNLVPGGIYQVYSIGVGRFNNYNLSCGIANFGPNERFWCYPSLYTLGRAMPTPYPSGCGNTKGDRFGTAVADSSGHFYWKFTMWEGYGRCYYRGYNPGAQYAACSSWIDAYRVVPISLSFTITTNNPFFDDGRIIVPPGTPIAEPGNSCYRERYIVHNPDEPLWRQPLDYDFIQTFHVDSSAVAGAGTVDLTSVELFIKRKPSRTDNKSGIEAPAIWISIVDVDNNGKPTDHVYEGSLIRKEYDQITTSTDSTISTKFAFPEPVRVPTNRKYGIKILYEDEDYDMWVAKTGHRLVGTNNPSTGATADHNGDLYQSTNYSDVVVDDTSGEYSPVSDIDLKFKVNIARYQSDSLDFNIRLVPKDFEFISLDTLTDQTFFDGETVYQQQLDANGNWIFETGTITANMQSHELIGDGVDFTTYNIEAGSYIYLESTTDGNTDCLKVESVISATKLKVADYPQFAASNVSWTMVPGGYVAQYHHFSRTIVIKDSSANSTLKFETNTNSKIEGINSGATANCHYIHSLAINKFTTNMHLNASQATTVNMTHNFAYWDGTNHRVNSPYEQPTDLQGINHMQTYAAVLMSRSLEVADPTYLYSSKSKSAVFELNSTYDNQLLNDYVYEAPLLMKGGFSIVAHRFYASNVSTNEHKNKGDALARHVSKRVTLIDNKKAEDLVVYMTAYKPANTDIKVYAKLHNSEDAENFEDKLWTELDVGLNKDKFSSISDREDVIEYAFGIPNFPKSGTTINGVISTDTTANVTGVGTSFLTDLTDNQVIKIYNTLIPDNYHIGVVDSVVSDTEFNLKEPIANTSLQSDGLKIDTLTLETTAFRNKDRFNAVRYYNSSKTEFDSFDSFAIKIVLLTDSPIIIPYVDDIRAIGVSA